MPGTFKRSPNRNRKLSVREANQWPKALKRSRSLPRPSTIAGQSSNFCRSEAVLFTPLPCRYSAVMASFDAPAHKSAAPPIYAQSPCRQQEAKAEELLGCFTENFTSRGTRAFCVNGCFSSGSVCAQKKPN